MGVIQLLIHFCSRRFKTAENMNGGNSELLITTAAEYLIWSTALSAFLCILSLTHSCSIFCTAICHRERRTTVNLNNGNNITIKNNEQMYIQIPNVSLKSYYHLCRIITYHNIYFYFKCIKSILNSFLIGQVE